MNIISQSKIAIWALCATILASAANGTDLFVGNKGIEVAAGAEPTAKFSVRLNDVDSIDPGSLKASIGGKPAAGVKLEPLEQSKTLVYFLIDVSKQAGGSFSKEQVEEAKEFSDQLTGISRSGSEYEVGIGTIGSGFKDYGIQLSKVAREAILDRIATSDQDQTSEIYRGTADALEAMKRMSSAPNKVLVVLSSGVSTDTDESYRPEKIIEKAKAQDVPVFVVGYSASSTASSSWQTLRKVAKETGGAFVETNAEKKPVRAPVNEFHGIMNTMKTINVSLKDMPAGKQPLVVTMELNGNPVKDGGPELKVEREIEVPAPQEPAVAAPTTPGTPADPAKDPAQADKDSSENKTDKVADEKKKEAAKPTPWWKQASGKPWFLPAVVGGGVMLLAILGWIIFKLTRKPEPTTFSAEIGDGGAGSTWEVSPTLFDGAPEFQQTTTELGSSQMGTTVVIGWLEELDKAGNKITRHPMSEGKVTIGRSSDNDLTFNHDSVSIHHATVHRRSDRSLAVTDLRSSNGVYINNKRVEHSVLKDGDLIELGEIRLKVVLNQSPN